MQNPWQGKTVLITGASSGIGAATASRLAAEGLTVALVARRRERLEELAEHIQSGGGKAHVFPADLTVEEQRTALFEQVEAAIGIPDVLVNNAGYTYLGYLDEMNWADARMMIEINDTAAVHLTRLVLPGMIARRSGHVINMSSVTGLMPSQGNAVYAASKAFLTAFSTALVRELHGSGVRVSAVHPGPVRTEIFDVAANLENAQRVPAENSAIPPEEVAEEVWNLLRRPHRSVIVPWHWSWVVPTELLFGWVMDRTGPFLLRKRW